MKAGMQEHGTERGAEVRCGPRAIIIVRTYSLDWWTGLTHKSVKCLFQCRTEAKHTYLFTKTFDLYRLEERHESRICKQLSE